MNITDVRVKLSEKEGIFRASISITIDTVLVIRGYSVMEKNGKEWVNKPSKKIGTEYVDQVFGLDKETNTTISDKIMAAYRAAKGNVKEPSSTKATEEANGFASTDDDDDIPF